jgi:hypothetical protein
MLGKYARPGVRKAAVVACAVLLGVVAAAEAAPRVGSFQKRASSPEPVNNVVVDPTTNLVYAQQFEGNHFYRYNPRANKWATLRNAPVPQLNNGGAAYLHGKIYTTYSRFNQTRMGVYNVGSGKWSTIANPLAPGAADITAHGGLLYLAFGNDFISYDPATHVTTPLAPPPISFSSYGGLAPYKGKIYGTEGDGLTGFAAYDIATNMWTSLPDVPDGTVQGAAIDPVSGTFFAYGSYRQKHFYRYKIASGNWSSVTFPDHILDDGGMAYVSTRGLQGIYAGWGQGNVGLSRYVTPAPHH